MIIPNSKGGNSIEVTVRRLRQEAPPAPDVMDAGDENWPGYGLTGPDRYNAVICMVAALPRLAEDRLVSDIIKHCLEPEPEKRWPSSFLLETIERAMCVRDELVDLVNDQNLKTAASWPEQ